MERSVGGGGGWWGGGGGEREAGGWVGRRVKSESGGRFAPPTFSFSPCSAPASNTHIQPFPGRRTHSLAQSASLPPWCVPHWSEGASHGGVARVRCSHPPPPPAFVRGPPFFFLPLFSPPPLPAHKSMLSATALRLVARELKDLADKPEDGIRVRERERERESGEERKERAREERAGGARLLAAGGGGGARPKIEHTRLTRPLILPPPQVAPNEDNLAEVIADYDGPGVCGRGATRGRAPIPLSMFSWPLQTLSTPSSSSLSSPPPAGTPYEGGAFRLRLDLGPDFPTAPPKGTFLTKVFHPNVSAAGEVCVNVLKKDWQVRKREKKGEERAPARARFFLSSLQPAPPHSHFSLPPFAFPSPTSACATSWSSCAACSSNRLPSPPSTRRRAACCWRITASLRGGRGW